MKKLKLTAVSYLNTKPFLYGILNKKLDEKIDIELDIPSVCAAKLASGAADLGLVPVAIIPEIPDARLVSDFCIGADGAVKTVCVFGERPIEELTHIYLDYHSRTSVELVKILLRDYWKVSPMLIPAEPGFEREIRDTQGALIIGDRAIGLEEVYPYTYDLAEAWQNHTRLPFVFAAWVSNKELDPDFLTEFNEALRAGIASIPQLIYLIPPPHRNFDLKTYFTRYISYPLDAAKREGLELFLSLMKKELLATHKYIGT